MLEMERKCVGKIIRGVPIFDNIIKEVLATTDDNRKKIRRRVEDYLRKCGPEDLALVVALFGIDTDVQNIGGPKP